MPSDVAPLKITSDLSLTAWIKLDSTASTEDIICKWTGTGATSSTVYRLIQRKRWL